MYIPCFLQVVFPYFEKMKNNKSQKEGKKVLKEISKDLKNIDPKKKKDENKT